MTNSQRLSAVRAALRQWIDSRHPDQEDSGKPLSEAMLIREGYFCGRRFHFSQYHAVWFLEEDEVKIMSTDGAVLGRLGTSQIDALAEAAVSCTPQTRTLSIAAHREQTLAAPVAVSQQQAEKKQSIHEQSQRRAA